MARSLDQVLAEINPYYDSSRKVVQSQLDAIPGETQAGIAQADAKLADANTSILDSARSRGLGFSGIPVSEQAKYAATDYAPAIANLKSTEAGKATSLAQALNQYNLDAMTQAQGIHQNEVSADQAAAQLAEQQRQFNEQMAYTRAKDAADRAAAAASAGGSAGAGAYLSGGDAGSYVTPSGVAGAPSAAGSPAGIRLDKKSGYSFMDNSGQKLNALEYSLWSQQTGNGIGYRRLLSQMASTGDRNAKVALQYVGNDGKFVNAPESARAALKAVGAVGSFAKAPAPKKTSSVSIVSAAKPAFGPSTGLGPFGLR